MPDGDVVDEGTAAAVGGHDPAQDQLPLERDRAVLEQGLQLVRLGRLELRDDRALLGAGAHEAAVAAAAQGQAQRIQDDRLAGAGLAGEHGQAAGEAELEALDQHDVADREAFQHRRLRGRGLRAGGQNRRLSQDPSLCFGSSCWFCSSA